VRAGIVKPCSLLFSSVESLYLDGFYIKQDSYSSNTSYVGRVVWITYVALGVFFGLFIRLKS
jgi:hypothetical protein